MKKAFTLIELLTVMAITAVMLTLIVLPIFQSFNLTRAAQAFADAQDKGRSLVDSLSREVGNAVSVRNLGSTIAPIPQSDGTVVNVELPYTKMDLIPPAEGDPSMKVNGAFIDPNTGKGDPTLTRAKGDIRLPVAPGQVYVRWWVGLNNPTLAYNEPYTGIIMARNGGRDNLFVLHRAVVQPFIYRLRKDGAAGSGAWRPNLAYFRSDDPIPNAPSGTDYDTRIIDLDDPYFFVGDGKYLPEGGQNPGDRQPDADKNNRVLRWAGILVPNDPMIANGMGSLGHSTNQTEVSRYDMVRPTLQGSPPQPVKDGSGHVLVVPLVQFRPARVTSAPATPSAAARPGEAVEGLDNIGPDTYQTERGLWANAIVRYYPSSFAPTATSLFEVANVNSYGGVTISAGGTSGDGLDTVRAYPKNFELFNLQSYEQILAKGEPYPFTRAAINSAITDTTPGYPGVQWMDVDEQRKTFTPFRVLTATGKIITSFPIEEVGDVNVSPRPTINLPYVAVANPQSPTQAGTGDAAAPLSPTVGAYDPNRAFNRLWNAYPELQDRLQRFIDLRWVPNEDGTLSPLCPLASAGKVTGFNLIAATSRDANGNAVDNGGLRNRVRIVPGSDEVYGPDQTTTNGTYAATVRYTRVSGNPGPNQYRLVYADLPEPTNPATGLVDYSVLGLSDRAGFYSGFSPTTYDGTDVVSSAFQSQYKGGYLQLCSDPNVPVPAGRVTVRYRFQFSGPGDTFAVDHDTREILQILLTIKNYPQSSLPNAQTVTLKSTATLRNVLR